MRIAPTSATAAPILFDVEFAEMGGEGATPYEVLLHAAMVGESTRFTRQDGVEETWRIMQPLLDCAAAGARVRSRAPGAPRRPTSSWPVTVAGASPGSSRDVGEGRGGAAACRARRRPRRSRRSRTTPSSPTATRERSWRRTARSTGSACRASTRRACSAACSIGEPACSAWRRSASTTRPRASTSRERTSSRRPGRRRTAGSSSAPR